MGAERCVYVCSWVWGSSELEKVTHEAWCPGLSAALVSSSAEVLTVALMKGEQKEHRKEGKRCEETSEGQSKNQKKKPFQNSLCLVNLKAACQK